MPRVVEDVKKLNLILDNSEYIKTKKDVNV